MYIFNLDFNIAIMNTHNNENCDTKYGKKNHILMNETDIS